MNPSANSRDSGMVHYLLAYLSDQKEKGEELKLCPEQSSEDKNYYKKVQKATPFELTEIVSF